MTLIMRHMTLMIHIKFIKSNKNYEIFLLFFRVLEIYIFYIAFSLIRIHWRKNWKIEYFAWHKYDKLLTNVKKIISSTFIEMNQTTQTKQMSKAHKQMVEMWGRKRQDIRSMSRQEESMIYRICDELRGIHECSAPTGHIKHYCCIVPHGRSKRQREICGIRKKQPYKAIQYTNPSCRDWCI